MPALKDIMVQQTSIPRNIEASLPAMAPKVSKILSDIALKMPTINLPGGGAGGATPSGFPSIIKGFEGVFRPVTNQINGGATPVTASGARQIQGVVVPIANIGAKRIMGGGYRSI